MIQFCSRLLYGLCNVKNFTAMMWISLRGIEMFSSFLGFCSCYFGCLSHLSSLYIVLCFSFLNKIFFSKNKIKKDEKLYRYLVKWFPMKMVLRKKGWEFICQEQAKRNASHYQANDFGFFFFLSFFSYMLVEIWSNLVNQIEPGWGFFFFLIYIKNSNLEVIFSQKFPS